MTDAFIRAAEAKGHEVARFDAAMMKIGGCHACETCFKTGKACSFDDDFNRIAPAILEADALVFTMPAYWYSIPSQIKGVIDRIYSLVVGGKDIAGKECALIACCEEDDLSVLDGVRIPMERTAALNKWKMVGEVLARSRRAERGRHRKYRRLRAGRGAGGQDLRWAFTETEKRRFGGSFVRFAGKSRAWALPCRDFPRRSSEGALKRRFLKFCSPRPAPSAPPCPPPRAGRLPPSAPEA